jgi:hypothetical protein
MAVKNVGGHGVTPMLNGSHHTVARPAQPNFVPTQGPADHNGGSSSGGFPAARGKRNGQAQSPAAQTPANPMTMAGGGGQ